MRKSSALLLFRADALGKSPTAEFKDGHLEFLSPILAHEKHWNPSIGGLTIHLLPSTLGALRLRINSSASGLRVAIHTSSEKGLVTLAAKRDELVSRLRAQGVSIAELVLLQTEPTDAREMSLGYDLERDQFNKSHQSQEKFPKQKSMVEHKSDETINSPKSDNYILI
jgi:hypothetical protein